MARFLTCCVALTVAAQTITPAASAVSPAVSTAASAVSRTAAAPGRPAAAAVYSSPVAGRLTVLRGFSPPATRYGAGHLGVDLSIGAHGQVLAAGDGTVRYAGAVAGRGVVVIAHPDGLTTEYEPLAPLVHGGTVVHRGQVIGTVRGRHRGCPGTCLHWGARRGDVYVDPLALLRPLAPVRLLPWSGGG